MPERSYFDKCTKPRFKVGSSNSEFGNPGFKTVSDNAKARMITNEKKAKKHSIQISKDGESLREQRLLKRIEQTWYKTPFRPPGTAHSGEFGYGKLLNLPPIQRR